MTNIEQRWYEIPVALSWLFTSIVLMEVLDNVDWLVSALQPLTTLLLTEPSIFSGWNRNAPFNTEVAKTLTALFLLFVPAQTASVFMIPARSICQRAQAKGMLAFAACLTVLLVVQPLVFGWGLSISGPIKVFGRDSSWGAAAAICIVTLSFSYAVRMTPILLTMVCAKSDRQVGKSSA